MSRWRALAPHFLAMFVIYAAAVIAVWMVFDAQSFWISLAIALVIALFYPGITRSLGVEPEPWKREDS